MNLNNRASVIHNTQNLDFNNYIYTKVYSSSDTTVTINSTSVDLVKGVVLNMNIYEITPNPNVYLMGLNKNTLFPKYVNL